MRQWNKYLIGEKDGELRRSRDESPDEHRQSMGGYHTKEGYGSKKEFFDTFVHNRINHHYGQYHDYLKEHLNKEEQGLSIASGQCINELMLIEDGFNIICSDLEHFTSDGLKEIFPDMQFVKYDALSGPFSCKVDYVLSLGLLYLFNVEEMKKIFANVNASLNSGGRFIVDPSGAEDNSLLFWIDEVLCKYEQHLRVLTKSDASGKKCTVYKKHHGYRSTNEEILQVAEQAGFKKVSYSALNNEIECGRSWLIRKLPKSWQSSLGDKVPYVRFFEFVKE